MNIDLLKLMRAVHLDCERTGYGHVYLVSGGARRHTVNLDGPQGSECDCFSFQRDGSCKHEYRALLAEGEPSVLKGLRQIVPNPDKRAYRRQVAA